jgi:murein DD-endopeptidase MepM/ murein hydrolase activator NlpD
MIRTKTEGGVFFIQNGPTTFGTNEWLPCYSTYGPREPITVYRPDGSVYVTSNFHGGNDIGPNVDGWRIYNIAPEARVIAADWHDSPGDATGMWIALDHGNDYWTLYYHLKGPVLPVGSIIPYGSIVGFMNNTGVSTGVHLHFECRKNGNKIDSFGDEAIAFYNTAIPSTPPPVVDESQLPLVARAVLTSRGWTIAKENIVGLDAYLVYRRNNA